MHQHWYQWHFGLRQNEQGLTHWPLLSRPGQLTSRNLPIPSPQSMWEQDKQGIV